MAGELSQRELEELVVGKQQKPTVVFYDKARIDIEQSKIAGRRVYRTSTYVNERQAGITDWVAELAKPHHIKTYPREYKIYLDGVKETSPSVGIIPNINPAELQELIDMGLATIERLAATKIIPNHLSTVWKKAKILQSVLEEQKDGQETETAQVASERTTENVPTSDRFQHGNVVGQRGLPDSLGSKKDSATSGFQENRQVNNTRPVISDNWSIQF